MKRTAITLILVASIALLWSNISFASSNKPVEKLKPSPRPSQSTSANWSGYAVETSLANPLTGSVSDVYATWTVPTAQASSATNAYSATWVGMDGFSSSTVEQIGTEQDWVNGQARYYAWWEMYPKGSVTISNPVYAGDSITAEVKSNPNGTFTLTLIDSTPGHAFTFTTTQFLKQAKRSSAEWVVEAPAAGGILPLANFDKETFTGCGTTIQGSTGSIVNTSWQKSAITMVNSGGGTKAAPYGLSTDGTSFSVQWYGN